MPDEGKASDAGASVSTAANVTATEIAKVGVRLPPFWPEEPEIWFAQVEAQFTNSSITSDLTKFNYVIGHLEPQFAREVKDIIINPPQTDRYLKLKTELVKRLSASQARKVKQLLTHEELGDRKPSQFLRHLQSLAGPTVPDDFIQTLWTNRLPGPIQTVLAAQPTASLEVLADLADRIQDIAPSTPQVAAASQSTPSSLDAIMGEVAELRRQVERLTTGGPRQSRSRTRGSQRSRSPSTRSDSNYRKFPECWYHFTFGGRARRCIKPCSYKAENSRGSQ